LLRYSPHVKSRACDIHPVFPARFTMVKFYFVKYCHDSLSWHISRPVLVHIHAFFFNLCSTFGNVFKGCGISHFVDDRLFHKNIIKYMILCRDMRDYKHTHIRQQIFKNTFLHFLFVSNIQILFSNINYLENTVYIYKCIIVK